MKILLTIAGLVALGLGILGIFLPVLPTTPLLLLAAALFLRSNARLYGWLMNHPKLGVYIRNFMELFQSIDVHSENFNQCCTMFRHAVNIALKLDEKLRTVDGVAILRSAMDVEIDGSANLSRATIAKSYGSDQSLCEKCRSRNSKTPCAENMFAKKFEYIVHECKYFDTLTVTDIAQAIIATENDQSHTLVVKDPVNGNEYTLNITDVDDEGRLIASVAKIIK